MKIVIDDKGLLEKFCERDSGVLGAQGRFNDRSIELQRQKYVDNLRLLQFKIECFKRH